jgi:YVTN family beta-propeller protein
MLNRRCLLAAVLMLIAASCHSNGSDELNNTPIPIPSNAAFALRVARGNSTVTVIDMDGDSIVGTQRVSTNQELIWDMIAGPDGMLYLTLCEKDFDHLGRLVRVFDPGEGTIVSEIAVDPDPERIYVLSDSLAVIAHQFQSAADSAFATTLLEMGTRSAKRTIRLKNMLTSVAMSSSGQHYLYYSQFSPFFPLSSLYCLDTASDSLQKSMQMNDSISNGPMAFVGDNKLYFAATTSVVVREFPSGALLKTIDIGKTTSDMLALPNGKVYVSLSTGEAWEYGNYDSLRIIDVATDEVTKTIQVCKGPFSMTYSKAENKVYVAGYCGSTISVIDPDRDSVVKTIVSDLAGENDWGYHRIVVNH